MILMYVLFNIKGLYQGCYKGLRTQECYVETGLKVILQSGYNEEILGPSER